MGKRWNERHSFLALFLFSVSDILLPHILQHIVQVIVSKSLFELLHLVSAGHANLLQVSSEFPELLFVDHLEVFCARIGLAVPDDLLGVLFGPVGSKTEGGAVKIGVAGPLVNQSHLQAGRKKEVVFVREVFSSQNVWRENSCREIQILLN